MRIATLALAAPAAASQRRGARGHQCRRHAVGDRSRGVAWHTGKKHARNDRFAGGRWSEGQLHHSRRQVGHHRGSQEHPQADQRRQGRRHYRLDGDAQFTGDARCRERSGSTDDFHGRISGDHCAPTRSKTKWVFKTPQNDSLMADAVAVSMRANGVQTVGFIGFADAYGDSWLAEMKRSAQTAGIKIVAEEKYNRNDPSVTGQVLKLLAAQPDAVLIAGPERRRPHRTRNWSRAATRARSTRPTASPMPTSFASLAPTATARSSLPARCWSTSSCPNNRVKKSAAEYVQPYEAKYGPGSRSTFGGHAWDAYMLLAARDSRGAEKRSARYQGLSRGASRRARKCQGRCREQRRVQHDRRRPQWDGQSRARHRQYRKRQMGSAEMTGVATVTGRWLRDSAS